MDKCSRCSRRKAKRSCPGLNERICSRCCGALRFEVVDCPADCAYLGGAAERKQRAGKQEETALELYNRERMGTFTDGHERYAAFLFESVCFRWWKDHPGVNPEAIAVSYERASRIHGRIVLPGDDQDPLAQLLAEAPNAGAAFTRIDPPPGRAFFAKVLGLLAGFARRYEEMSSPWKGYFRGLEYVFSRVHPREQAGPEDMGEEASLLLPDRTRPGTAPRAQGGLIVLPGE